MKKFLCLISLLLAFSACPNPTATEPDSTPPTGTIVINNNDAYTVSTSVTLALTASDDSGVTGIMMMISNTPDFSGAAWETFSASRAWTLLAGDTVKTVYIKFKDAAGNESAVFSASITLDSTLPGPPSAPDLAAEDDTGISSSDNITRNTTGLTFSGTGAEANAAVRLYDAATGLLGSCAADANGNWSLDINLAEGGYNLYARAQDAAGNISPSSPTLVVTIDTTPPSGVPAILKPMQGENTGANKRPQFTWTSAAEAAAYELQADDSSSFTNVNYDWTNLSGTNYKPDTDMSASAAVPVGTRYYLRLRALDTAGNGGAWSNPGLLRYVNVGRFDSDFNGDGHSDAIVGAPFSNEGKAYIYLGGSSLDGIPDLTLTGEAPGDRFGLSATSAGDVNGDGYADIIVGAYLWNSGYGKAYIYLGGSSLDGTADLILAGGTGAHWGWSVASAGDVNADGYADFIVGSPDVNVGQGSVRIYMGDPSLAGNCGAEMTGGAPGERFGYSVASAGDVNGDGCADVIVGAPGHNSNQGRACVFLGSSTMSVVLVANLIGEAPNDNFGCSVASAGDANGDGYSDFIVGAYGYGSSQGRAYVYLGGSSLDHPACSILSGETTGSCFGRSVASAGDVNGDGYSDFIVGADGYNSNQGRAYVYRGGSSLDGTADLILTGETTGDHFGWSVASDGDMNGDGYFDSIVGAYAFSTSQGRAYVYLGGLSQHSTADLIMTGEKTGAWFGYSVAWVGNGSADAEQRQKQKDDNDLLSSPALTPALRGRTISQRVRA